MHLFLIRHGQSYVNLPDWSGTNWDQPLTELGQRQATALATWLPQRVEQAAAIYASTMLRARETVAPLASMYGQPIRFDDRVREIGNNRFDHTPWGVDDQPGEFSSFWASERPFAPVMKEPLSETLMHFRARVGAFIEELAEAHAGEQVLVICHGGVIEFAFDHIFNIGPWRRCEVWTHNTGVTHFEYVEHPRREVWRLRSHDSIDHLTSELLS
ncbi:MAG: histidine phosphatase family protein [Caldilinea sp.]|uniref:histidine phosphatase family protein n=1 Tax=Caldilinea sp. TaxID=2293560 RepID=UPI002C3E4447|nr:histidine phosphatase family protein [Anaerolineales bacterium]HQY92269.1 histidine phosphatase family protein [Caldilinea sp.]HRA64793.1 histidine phosphatase family protein [Caldilinea sp.]